MMIVDGLMCRSGDITMDQVVMMVIYALDDYFYNQENRDKMTRGERVGASEVFVK